MTTVLPVVFRGVHHDRLGGRSGLPTPQVQQSVKVVIPQCELCDTRYLLAVVLPESETGYADLA